MNRKIVIMMLLPLLTCGCASAFYENHFFKSETSSAATIPNYYRLKIMGTAILSSSRYVSGYFDEDTINTYFNEYTQPAGAAIAPRPATESAAGKPTTPPSATKTEAEKSPTPPPATKAEAEKPPTSPPATKTEAQKPDTSGVEPVSKGLKGKKLVMILSSNSDEISTQIGALAGSKQFTASLAGLMARDQYMAADAADSRLTIEKSRAKATSDLAKQLVEGLDDKATEDDATKALLGFINMLASDLGYDGVFNKLGDAAEWLRHHRARLLRGER
jgi:hypothetical protein